MKVMGDGHVRDIHTLEVEFQVFTGLYIFFCVFWESWLLNLCEISLSCGAEGAFRIFSSSFPMTLPLLEDLQVHRGQWSLCVTLKIWPWHSPLLSCKPGWTGYINFISEFSELPSCVYIGWHSKGQFYHLQIWNTQRLGEICFYFYTLK